MVLSLTLGNLLFSFRGHVRLFFGGRFNSIQGLFNPFVVLLLIMLAAAVCLFVFTVIRNFKRANLRWPQVPGGDPLRRSLALLCSVWVSVYLVFLFFWLPHNTFYRLFYLPALILLGGLVMPSDEKAEQRPRTYRLVLLVAIMGIANFLFLIFPFAHAQKYPPLSFALKMKQVWPQGTVVYYGSANTDNSLFEYFNPATIWKPLSFSNTGALESELQDVYRSGLTAWLEASAIDQLSATPAGRAWLSSHAKEASRRELNDPAFRISFVQVVPGASAETQTELR